MKLRNGTTEGLIREEDTIGLGQKTDTSKVSSLGTDDPNEDEASASDQLASVFAVFPKKTYKTVSVYTLVDRPTRELEMVMMRERRDLASRVPSISIERQRVPSISSERERRDLASRVPSISIERQREGRGISNERQRRDLASRVPSISIERQRERMELDRLGERVESVLKLEKELAGIAHRYDGKESHQGGRILGSLVQTLVLVRNTKLLPVLLNKWAEELEVVLEQVTEETLADLLLWGTVLHWWDQTVEGGGVETCAELVYGISKTELQKGHLVKFITQSTRTDKVRRVLEKGGWAKREDWKSMEKVLAPRVRDGQFEVSKNLPFLENLFLLEEIGMSKEDSDKDICKTHSREELLNLNPHPKGSIMAEVQELFDLIRVHLHFALDGLQKDQLKLISSKLEALSGVRI